MIVTNKSKSLYWDFNSQVTPHQSKFTTIQLDFFP